MEVIEETFCLSRFRVFALELRKFCGAMTAATSLAEPSISIGHPGVTAYPREIHFVGSLPKVVSGKVQRFVLRQSRRKELPTLKGRADG
ncbi:hypothetical protein C7I87_21790 [Mesorhizobium sp. SARCC-RB16n]|nr:hypothetical protein C7I87_21790 [Mesorhizobium sp. SARCC-RB16n]